MTGKRDIIPGNELWHLVMKLYKEGKSYVAIGKHPRINKDHTTIMHHVHKAGLSRSFGGSKNLLPVVIGRAVYKPRKQRVVAYGKDRCNKCGVKLVLAPGHNCSPGNYYKRKPEDLYGHSFTD